MPQHYTYEETFHGNQSDDPGLRPASYLSQEQTSINAPGQKLLTEDLNTVRRTPSASQRLALAIVSIAFTFVICIGILFVLNFSAYGPIMGVALFILALFVAVIISINLIFNH